VFKFTTLVVIGSCKSEYHTITTTTASDVLNVVKILWYVEYVWYFSSLTGSQKPDLWWMSSVYLSKLLILNKGSRIYTTYSTCMFRSYLLIIHKAGNTETFKIVHLLASVTFNAPYFHYIIQTRTCINS
jgi:hypothetical protein